MELFPEERLPDSPFLIVEAVPVEEDPQIGKRRGVPGGDPQREIVEEVEVHEMVFVPVAEPNHLHLLFGAETDEPFPVRCRIDEDARAFDIEGVAEGITPPVFAGEETDRTKSAIFHQHLLGKMDREMAETFATCRDYRKEMQDLSSETHSFNRPHFSD
jgi:hypothetical protein